MRKATLLSCLAALCLALTLYGSDPWDKKPFQQWSEKDVERVLKNSPWAKEVSVTTGPPMPSGAGASSGRRGRGTGGNTVGGGMDTGGGEMAGGAGGMAAGGTADRGAGSGAVSGAALPPSVSVIVRWQSARPVKQALAKAKYGAEVETIPQIKELVDREETHYVIALAELPQRLSRMDPAVQKALKDITALAVKGKDPMHPEMIQLLPGKESAVIYFAFSRAKAITLEDKEVEFSTHIGQIEVKKKFKLQEMVFAGKLEL